MRRIFWIVWIPSTALTAVLLLLCAEAHIAAYIDTLMTALTVESLVALIAGAIQPRS